MAERILLTTKDGDIEPLEETAFALEDELQKLIAKHPELLDGEQMRLGGPRRWLLITREKGIAEAAGEGARWALDHLLVDQNARPTLAEVKRGWNSEIRRTIVGQVLEFAAHASETWTAHRLRKTFDPVPRSVMSIPRKNSTACCKRGRKPTQTHLGTKWPGTSMPTGSGSSSSLTASPMFCPALPLSISYPLRRFHAEFYGLSKSASDGGLYSDLAEIGLA